MARPIATPVTPVELEAIRKSEVWHYSKATYDQIVLSKLVRASGQPNAFVRLSPPTGWQLDFWRLIRDLTVFDPDSFAPADYGRYLYGFLGEPTPKQKNMNVQEAPLTIRIPGEALVAAVPASKLFFRPMYKTVVVRGDYVGPALVEPPP
jgi:hypothetical protein